MICARGTGTAEEPEELTVMVVLTDEIDQDHGVNVDNP